MLSDKVLARLCHGRIIWARTYDSAEADVTSEHPAIVIASTEQIKKSKKFRVVFVSNNDTIDRTYILPVPAVSGLKGYVIGSWAPCIEEAAITNVTNEYLDALDMLKIIILVRRADAAKKAAKKQRD